MSHSQFQSRWFILRLAWLNLWDERMTTGRINQVAILCTSSWISVPMLTSLGDSCHSSCIQTSSVHMIQIKHQPPQTGQHEYSRISFELCTWYGNSQQSWIRKLTHAVICSVQRVSKCTSLTKPFFCVPLNYSHQGISAPSIKLHSSSSVPV